MSDELSTQATDVQPDEGQGDLTATQQSEVQPEGQGQQDSQSTGLYDLSSIEDPAIRAEVERIAKDIDRNVQSKLQDAAQFRKAWSPFEEIGLQDMDPADVRALLQFSQAISNETTAQDAVLELAKHVGLEVQGLGDDVTDEDDDELDPFRDIRSDVESLKAERAAEKAAVKAEAARQTEMERLQSEWDEVETQHGTKFDEEETALLLDLADRFDSEDEPIKLAYKLFNQIAGRAEKQLVQAKSKEPGPAEPAGRASTAVDAPQTFEEAQAAFTARRAAQSQVTA